MVVVVWKAPLVPLMLAALWRTRLKGTFGRARMACSSTTKVWRDLMTETIVPHFHNTPGVGVIEIGAREFMCVGELPPFDHPHVYLDMGDANEIICPYCSTLFRHDPSVASNAARPPECALPDRIAS
jgi:uncharacterized Zn-finger protein